MKETAAGSSSEPTKGCDDSTAPCPVLVQNAPATTPAAPIDPDLARVVAAWPGLPDALKRAVLALIGGP